LEEGEWNSSSAAPSSSSGKSFEEDTETLLPSGSKRSGKSKKKKEAGAALSLERSASPDNNPTPVTDSRFLWYRRMVLFNAVVIECPLAVSECLVRSLLCLVVATVLALIFVLFCNRRACRWSLSFLSESVLLGAAGLTCCVPILPVCMIYWRYDPSNDDWCMLPLWTVVGKVDARRLLAFSFGGGSSAANVFVRTLDDSKSAEKIPYLECQDSWGHRNELFFPRPLFAYIDSLQYDDVEAADTGDTSRV
jgi:hypothetical protein